MKRKINLRSVIAFAVTLMLLGMAIPALAVGSAENKIVINAPKGEPGEVNRFVAYQIFEGTLTGSNTQLNDINWGSGVDSSKMVAALKSSQLSVPARSDEPFQSEKTAFGEQFTDAYQTYSSSLSDEMNEATFVAQWLGAVSKNLTGRTDANPYADAFARIVADNLNKTNGINSTQNKNDNGVQWTINVNDAGYYLMKDTYTGTEASVSTYILDVLGSQTVEIKASIPTVDKRVEDDHQHLGSGAIYRPFETMNYMIVGTVAKNIDEYDEYAYTFTDTLSKGLDLVKYGTPSGIAGTAIRTGSGDVKTASAIKVYLYNSGAKPGDIQTVTNAVNNGTDGSKALTDWSATYENVEGQDGAKKLTISINDLKTAAGSELKATSQIVVVYAAMMNTDAVIGKTGNTNDVTVEYSNDPYTDSKGTTTPSESKSYTVGFNVNKVDGSNGDNPLKGAEFKLKRWDWTKIEDADGTKEEWNNIDSDSGAEVEWAIAEVVSGGGPEESPKYVIKEWTEDQNRATALATDDQGKMRVVGLRGFGVKHDEKTDHVYKANYALVETKTPSNEYEKIEDAIFTVSITVNVNGQLTEATMYRHSSNQNRTDVVMDNNEHSLLSDNATLATLKIRNYMVPLLPHTGGIGEKIVYVVSSLAVLVGIFILFAAVKKRRCGKHEQS